MKATDLMIGDWVLCDNTPYQIAEIGGMVCIDYEKELFASLEDIQPIPLTPEILEKNGFVFNDNPIIQGWEQYGWILFPAGFGYSIPCGTNVTMRINGVHELQHAFKLCGIEKEVVL